MLAVHLLVHRSYVIAAIEVLVFVVLRVQLPPLWHALVIMDGSQFCESGRSLCKVSLQCDYLQKQEVNKVLELAKERVKLKASALIKDHAAQPMMFIYTSDGTPVRSKVSTAQTVQSESEGQKKISRSGFQRHEYLCQRGYFKCYQALHMLRVSLRITGPSL